MFEMFNSVEFIGLFTLWNIFTPSNVIEDETEKFRDL